MAELTKNLIQKLLSESKFDPRNNPAMSIIIEMNNPDYLEGKAVELIYTAQQALIVAPDKPEEYHNRISQAISILVLARAQRSVKNGAFKTKPQKRARSRNPKRNNSVSGTEGVASS